jgi:hypothetical protein
VKIDSREDVSEGHKQMMSELRDALKALLKLDLEADATVDSKGTLHCRIFEENVHFGVEFGILQVRDWAEGAREECEVTVKTELLPGVNDFGKYFPYTKSNRVVREVNRVTREVIGRTLGKSVNVVIDNTIGINAAILVGTLGVLFAFAGGLYGFLFTASGAGGLEGAAAGGALGACAMALLIFRSMS